MCLLPRLPATLAATEKGFSLGKLVRAPGHGYPQRSRGSSTMVLLRGDAAQANCLTHQNGDALGLHLLHYLRAVALDRSRADGELGGNRLAGEPLHNEVENLDLARRQARKLGGERIERLLHSLLGEDAR